ncbi:short chain dehydrogenase [Enemella dayhoffiae]|uniref:Short chain dehydrogenase n=1 Tax=Enemella dayhoffiae TaxID=2016507 RepID=A0A255GZK8_9ACTN|nr:SDR family oxidoreductase [Enemella dayhoffiae]OYO20792.1 short chain dehydrogenase [Enemella dayhoffiae]
MTARPIALITGASRGIGRAIAFDLGRDHHVLVGGTHAEAVDALVAELPSAAPFTADLTDPARIAELAADIPSLDVLVHSAGISVHGPIAEVDHDEWTRVLAVNVVAVADLTRLLLPALRTAGGQLISINSGAGYTARPGTGPYAASKFALRALTDALREEERGRVRVSSIHPGRVDTDMQREIQARRGNDDYRGEIYLTPESVAAAVRLAVDATDEAMVESILVRPVVT